MSPNCKYATGVSIQIKNYQGLTLNVDVLIYVCSRASKNILSLILFGDVQYAVIALANRNKEHPAQGKRFGLPLSELISLESYGVDRTVKFSLSFDEDLAKNQTNGI